MMWACPSMKPGIIVLPSKSIISVFRSLNEFILFKSPVLYQTVLNCNRLILELVESTVYIVPPYITNQKFYFDMMIEESRR